MHFRPFVVVVETAVAPMNKYSEEDRHLGSEKYRKRYKICSINSKSCTHLRSLQLIYLFTIMFAFQQHRAMLVYLAAPEKKSAEYHAVTFKMKEKLKLH